MHEALDDATVWKVVCQKSAQVAWTDGVLLNYIGKRIDLDPCAMIVMFAKEGSGKKFDREKFIPMVEVTPALSDKIPIHKARDRNNSWDHKGFPGGFLNFVGSNSPDSVKSTPAPVVAVEEPDDANTNVKEQGDTITLLEERTKSFPRRKVIFGGTPTIDGFSRVASAYLASDQRKFWVPCPDCGELQVLMWSNVRWVDKPEQRHEVYGSADPSSARYQCEHCGSLWTDAQKNAAVRQAKAKGGGWRASAPFNGVAGFYINEVYSPFPGSLMARLVEKRLAAEHALAQGDDTKIRSFRNNTEGLPYAYKSSVPSADALKQRGEEYAELTVPWGGVVLTAGVDVQHDRLAVIIRAWGRGEESWLVWWGEIYGRTLLVKWDDNGKLNREQSGAWWDLDQLLTSAFPHVGGGSLRLRAATIDSGDGQTMEAVYSYVRRRLTMGFMAGKGESHDPKRDVFSPPKLSIDTTGRHKPHPSGVRPYMVGTQVAKDLLWGVDEKAGRIKLLGDGPGRMHWYRTVRPDYYDQITAEVKVPHKTIRGRFTWQCLAGRRNEAGDCEVYALHSARSLKINLWREERWQAEEAALRQPALFGETAPPAIAPAAAVQTSELPPAAASDDNVTNAGTTDKPSAGNREAVTASKPRPAPDHRSTLDRSGRAGGGWSAKKW